nr:hypothetical protein [uncultured Carboxylicivirga sp.]
MINGYYEFDCINKTLEFPKLSHNSDDSDLFIPQIKFINNSFIETIDGKGDSFSYVSGQPINIIHSILKNNKSGEKIEFKIHSHWHYQPFNYFKNEIIPQLLRLFQNQLITNQYYKLNTALISGKIFKFIDENDNEFEFFAMTGEWINCFPTYHQLLRQLLSIIKSHYYTHDQIEHWDYLKSLNYYNIKVCEI